MPRGTYLSDVEKGKILAFLENGLSFREIGRKLGRSDKVVRNFAKNQSQYGKNKTGGPKRKLSERDRRRIVKAASNSMKSLSQISADCGVKVSNSTISKVRNESGTITRQSLITVPRLPQDRRKTARMEFAKKNLQTNWSQVNKYFYFFMYYN